jgi:hypothetical protein
MTRAPKANPYEELLADLPPDSFPALMLRLLPHFEAMKEEIQRWLEEVGALKAGGPRVTGS